VPRYPLDEAARLAFRGVWLVASSVTRSEWVNLAEFGNTIKRQFPKFQPQDYGERTLGALLRRLPNDFEIKANNNTPQVYYVRMLGTTDPSKGPPRPVSEPPSQDPRPRATGKIHNLRLGFGFIAPDDGSGNLFFHASDIIGSTIFDLRPGDPVDYEPGVNDKGPCASKVRRLPPGLVADPTLRVQTLRFDVDQAACLRKGVECPSPTMTIQIDAGTLPQEQRDRIADRLDRNDVCRLQKLGEGPPSLSIDHDGNPIRIRAKGPTYEDLWAAICEEEEDLKRPSPSEAFKKSLAEIRARRLGGTPPA
jgi:cold shock CspA family protein